MKRIGLMIQVAFTYIGTVVGAGFATGQEILQFFTRYGKVASFTIVISTILFVWLGIKLMLISNRIQARSYEDMNMYLFGEKAGRIVSLFMLIVMFGITTVMLAGAGSVFVEHMSFSFQAGLLLTIVCTYFILTKGINAILAVNSIVVPIMLFFTAAVVYITFVSPGAENAFLTGSYSAWRAWVSPFLYVAFNLSLAQAVLVPIGSAIADRKALIGGGVLGGIGIGIMLMAGHFALSAQMPGIVRFDIPMGQVAEQFGQTLQFLYVLVILLEILTTYLANVYGLTLQIEQRSGWPVRRITIAILLLSYLVSQIGFKTLLSTLYPFFGMVSMAWLYMIVYRRKHV